MPDLSPDTITRVRAECACDKCLAPIGVGCTFGRDAGPTTRYVHAARIAAYRKARPLGRKRVEASAKRVTVAISMPGALRDRLTAAAQSSARSASAIVCDALSLALSPTEKE